MADWHGSNAGYSRRSMKDEDFEEEDVWSVVKEREDSNPAQRKSKDYHSSVSSSSWRLQSSPRKIPTTNHESRVAQRSSAPMNIPDWSRIYGKHTGMKAWDDDGFVYDHGHGNGYRNDIVNNDNDDGDDDDDNEEEDGMIPPHEWIAKKLARSQICSFSVCEGIGRTLKGRDLSKLRKAILTKTGFLE